MIVVLSAHLTFPSQSKDLLNDSSCGHYYLGHLIKGSLALFQRFLSITISITWHTPSWLLPSPCFFYFSYRFFNREKTWNSSCTFFLYCVVIWLLVTLQVLCSRTLESFYSQKCQWPHCSLYLWCYHRTQNSIFHSLSYFCLSLP